MTNTKQHPIVHVRKHVSAFQFKKTYPCNYMQQVTTRATHTHSKLGGKTRHNKTKAER